MKKRKPRKTKRTKKQKRIQQLNEEIKRARRMREKNGGNVSSRHAAAWRRVALRRRLYTSYLHRVSSVTRSNYPQSAPWRSFERLLLPAPRHLSKDHRAIGSFYQRYSIRKKMNLFEMNIYLDQNLYYTILPTKKRISIK